jgi:hypothetical protein
MMGLLRKTFRISLITGIGVGLWKVVRSKTQFPWVGGNNGSSGGPPSVSAPAPPPPPAAVPVTPAAPASPAPASGESAGAARAAGPRSSKPAAGTGPARKAPTGRAEDPPGERLWVAANDGVCPQTHPVKAKLSSKIFHVPGGPHYSRTRADRCYPDEGAAVADGLRPPMH